MKYFILPALIGSLLLIGPPTARAVPTRGEMNLMNNAAAIFSQLPTMVPHCVLSNARGVVVIPSALKARFLFGGARELGLFVTRLPDGNWSAPSFVSFRGAKLDERFGIGVRNIILILNTPQAVAAAKTGTLYPWAGRSITAGPIGANFCSNCATPAVYSYVSSACTIFPATVKAYLLTIDYCTNRDVYGMANPLSMPGTEALGPPRNFDCAVARATGAPMKVCGLPGRGHPFQAGA